MFKFRVGFAALALAFALLGVPGSARADWMLGTYMGAARTGGNTLTLTPAGGNSIALRISDYEGEALRSPWYFGYRVARMKGDHGFGGEFEYTHAKVIAGDAGAPLLPQFQLTHGLNFLFGNLAYRTAPVCGGRCSFNVRGGLGITRPHVESTVHFQRDAHQEQYQWGALAWQAGAGAEFKLWGLIYSLADVRVTRVTEKHLRAAGAEIAGTFFTTHVDFGLGLRLPY